ncbi:MAG: DUF885 domain-containing protein [Bacillota bacterium]|nr:DUF885 domain-containing protein [Bacillota bacterium]
MQIIKKYWKRALFSLFLLLIVLLSPHLISSWKTYRINKQFEQYTDELFFTDVQGNALNLHYTLAAPEKLGITDYPVSLGNFDPSQISSRTLLWESRKSALEKFPSECLSQQNQLTKDILCLAYETELLPGNKYLLEEYLSPSLGVQAQLPILLAEYTFRREQDVQDYIKLLASVDTYFQSILTFEQLKSQNGTFMSDTTVDRITEQCSAFITNPEENYLHTVFQEKLKDVPQLTAAKQKAYQKLHMKILQEQVLPAYQALIDGLCLLKGSGKNPGGLSGLPGGKAYYEYLLKSSCGIYETVEQIQTRLLKQLQMDMEESENILHKKPELIYRITEKQPAFSVQEKSSPEDILKTLQNKLLKDFPSPPETSYEVKYVHKDLEAYLSPAFYLTPPIDTLSPNDIYINEYAGMKGAELFTTLAHEGFPGHLYQTISFASTNPPKIRHLLGMSGYVEGWATYVETYAYNYADQDSDLSRLQWLNRSLNLCILSLLDTGIHYDGWSRETTTEFLSGFGITDSTAQQEIFQVIVEDPANYLKYYMGYLHFLDLREDCKKEMGEHFDIRKFHQKILEIGPCQFPVLEKYVTPEKAS